MPGRRKNARDDMEALLPGEGWELYKAHRTRLQLGGNSDAKDRNAKAAIFVEEEAARRKLGAPPPAREIAGGDTPILPAAPTKRESVACSLAEFAGKGATMWTAVKWVGDTMAVNDATPDMAPSSLAWGLHQWIREDKLNKRDFITSMLSKLLPSKAQVDEESDEQTDDQLDEDVDFFITARRFAALRQGSEGSARERDVATGCEERGPVGQSLSA